MEAYGIFYVLKGQDLGLCAREVPFYGLFSIFRHHSQSQNPHQILLMLKFPYVKLYRLLSFAAPHTLSHQWCDSVDLPSV